MILSQTIPSDGNEGALTGTTATVSLLSPPTNNSANTNLSQNSAWMKCHFHYKHNYFLDYFDDPIPDDSKIFVAAKRDHDTSYMSSNSNDFGQLYITKNCSNLTK